MARSFTGVVRSAPEVGSYWAYAGRLELQEKLEHCLENKPSLGEDIDGESVSFLRSLQAKHDVFKAATVTSAFNIANFSYNDKQRSQSIMVSCLAQ